MLLRVILPLLLLIGQTPPSDFAQSVTKAMPTWEADALARFEQAELAAVRRDLDDGVDDEQLRIDWDLLAALDKLLQVEYLI